MKLSEHIVDRLLETGEGDPNYQDDQLDMIVSALDKNGFSGAYYKEFDAYQGIYLKVPGVDKFWIEDRRRNEITFSGEESVAIGASRGGAEADLPHSCTVVFFDEEPDLEDMLAYIQAYHGVKIAHREAQKSAEQFMQEQVLR